MDRYMEARPYKFAVHTAKVRRPESSRRRPAHPRYPWRFRHCRGGADREGRDRFHASRAYAPRDSASYTHKRRLSKRGASTMASAVPQLPRAQDSQTPRDHLRLPDEEILLAGAQPLQVRPMTIHDECGGDQRGYENRGGRVKDDPYPKRQRARRNNGSRGNVSRAATIITNTSNAARSGSGVRYRKAPMKLATAFPPWNCRNTGKAWPPITASAAALDQNGDPSVISAAIQTAAKPFAISSRSVATATARPLERSTLVAPIFPLPTVRTSLPVREFHQQIPKRDAANQVCDQDGKEPDHA